MRFKDEWISSIGKYCRVFRMVHLEMTLREVASVSSSNEKSLSSFEHGRANNIQHLMSYALSCKTPEMRMKFYTGLTEVLEEIRPKESVE